MLDIFIAQVEKSLVGMASLPRKNIDTNIEKFQEALKTFEKENTPENAVKVKVYAAELFSETATYLSLKIMASRLCRTKDHP